ncbi:serine hydrolase domain-containing protein [Pseudomonas sp. M5]|uniref:serine hydrolase domain-containing protein n=1 Tax=Pseudomonas sp. M5 TaxID=1620788 RepID=UPI00195B691C|nr:serine hydrolase domain-containing protein [Pseudomonas sp. M5]MBM7396542.1 CubicO group peptidase (beta-lactamase class C family) [Pseudomonas sp. M5]HDS1754472.1 beta-lactamase family protein [Pseudomonas putida]
MSHRPHQRRRTASKTSQAIRNIVETAIADDRITGAVVLVKYGGELVCQTALGFADREAGRAMAVDSLFQLGSLSKLITSTAAMVLVAQGRIGLEDPISRWLPCFKTTGFQGSPSNITLRHLLSHTAGLDYGFLQDSSQPSYQRAGISDGLDRTALTLQENIERIARQALRYPPGSDCRYSLATDVVGALLASIDGRQSVQQALRNLVLDPLKMRDTRFQAVDTERLCAAYRTCGARTVRLSGAHTLSLAPRRVGLRVDPQRHEDQVQFASAGFGLIGTASDYLTLLETLRTGGAQLIPASYIEEMATPQPGAYPLAGQPGRGLGLGFSVLQDPVTASTAEAPGTWRHFGLAGHTWCVDPAQKLSMVMLVNNYIEGSGHSLGQLVVSAIYGADG